MSPANKRIIHLMQGEHFISDHHDVIVTTTLGSCVAACLFDPEMQVGGMNHFLLPDAGPHSTDMRYAAAAMEVLINGLMRRGVRRERMQARLFGGARMLPGLPGIGGRNAEAARQFLQAESISVIQTNLGGTRAMRVRFLPTSGRVRLSHPGGSAAPLSELAMQPHPGGIELFGNGISRFVSPRRAGPSGE